MKITELNNYLAEYVANDSLKSLLINGDWGIGKTYNITQFLNNIKTNKDIKAHYCSLFGCHNIDTLHQQLYAKFHPHKINGVKALSYVPLALNLTTSVGFGTGIDTAKLANDITENQINKSIKVKEKTCLVIFDDLERIANDSSLKMEELLGYFNRLRLENIKIIVLCNETGISEENLEIFKKFKEKVFDRSINIEECDNAVIEEFFGDNYKFLKNEALDLINNNLRTAYKISIFFHEASEFLKDNNIEVDTDDLLFICANIVSEFFTNAMSEKYKVELDERIKDGDDYISTCARLELEKQLSDEFKVTAISRNVAKYSVSVDSKIINSLYRLFVYLDKRPADRDNINNKFYEDKVFYLSDENRTQYIEDKIKLLNDCSIQIPTDEIVKEIVSWLRYCPWYFTDESLNDIINRILKLSTDKANKDIIESCFDYKYIIEKENAVIKAFYDLLEIKNKQKLENRCIEYFKSMIDNLDNYSGQFVQLQHFLGQNKIDVPNELIGSIVKNNFYIPDLSKDINFSLWEFCHSMCRFVVEHIPDKKEQLRNYLLSLKENKNSKCLSERVQSLINIL